MPLLSRLLGPILKPTLVTSSDIRRYVIMVTAAATAVALAIDVANQLTFFTGWLAALWSWTLTVVSVTVTAVPISLFIARSQRDLHRVKRELEIASGTDVLTGLPNRRALMQRVEDPHLQLMILVIVDIDRFKSVNDTYGHRAGDAVIRLIGQKLAADLGDLGFVGRLGGEEFALLAPSRSLDRVLAALERFRRGVAGLPLVVEGIGISVSISAGAAIRSEGDAFDQLYTDADEALYRAKALGRNRIELSPKLRSLGERTPRQDAA